VRERRRAGRSRVRKHQLLAAFASGGVDAIVSTRKRKRSEQSVEEIVVIERAEAGLM
jgi:hypothetical protein